MDFLKRNLSPITDQAWEEILETSKDAFKMLLTGRKFFDFAEPAGLEFSGIGTGKLDIPKKANYGIREFLPAVEARIPFALNIWELDNIERGHPAIELGALEEAASKLAEFEEKALFYGLKNAGLKGLKDSSEHDPVKPENQEQGLVKAVNEAAMKLQDAFVEGPYHLVVDPQTYRSLHNVLGGRLIKDLVQKIIGGEIYRSEFASESYLVSGRGGDFEFFPGVDISIGYSNHDNKDVNLYFTESFTFRINDPAAVVVIG